MLSEQELIKECIRGDARSQEVLYKRFSGRMYALCLRYARQRSDAADILQDGFVKVFTKLDQYSGLGSFEGWMRRIMVNTALRHYQKQRFDSETHGFEVMPDGHVEPDAVSNLSVEEMLELVHKLPDGYRTVFNLVAIEGFSHAESAELLGIEESTSRSQLTKARRMLAATINKITKRETMP